MDMRAVIIPKSDQLNSDDLISGPRTITITKVEIRPGSEQPVSIFFDGDNGKPWKTCKSMNRVLVNAWGPDANQYIGRSLTLYRDPNVKWGGMAVGGIRISHMTDIETKLTMALTETKGSRKPYTVQPLVLQGAGSKAAAPAISDGTKAAGVAAAAAGVAAYTKWLAGLDDDTKATVRPFHKEWSVAAKAADRAAPASAFIFRPLIGQPIPYSTVADFKAAMLDAIGRTDDIETAALMNVNAEQIGMLEGPASQEWSDILDAAGAKGWTA